VVNQLWLNVIIIFGSFQFIVSVLDFVIIVC